MENITRRDFMKDLGVLAALAASPLKALGEIELNLDWDEAIKENNLRKEVSELMKETNFRIEYHNGESVISAVRMIDYKKIIGFDMPVEKLYEIKNTINSWEDSCKKWSGMIFVYS